MKRLRILTAVLLTVATLTVFAFAFAKTSDNVPPVPYSADIPTLCFDSDGDFRILHLSDFHEWMGIEKEGFMNIEHQENLKPLLTDYVNSVLDEYSPDLVVLGGDNIFSLNWLNDLSDEGVSIKTYRAIAELFETREQYRTCTFGNHDSESARSKEDFVKVLTEYEYFVGGLEDGENFKAAVFEADEGGKDDFVGNYSIPIYKADGSVAYNVYVLDSGSYRSTGHAYSSITEEQTEWYLAESERLEKETGSIIPSLLFTHIPFIEVQEAYEAGGRLAGFYAGISPAETRSPIFEACFGRGDVKGIFFGHNHYNSATLVYERDGKEILLAVTPSCQAQSYEDTSTTMHARVIDIGTDGSFTTYVVSSDKNAKIEKVTFPSAENIPAAA